MAVFQGNSRGHLKIRELLEDNDFNFQEEYSFEDLKASSGRLLAFDFMVFDEDDNIDFAIEVNGEQHYEPIAAFGGTKKFHRQKFNDQQKRLYCLNHHIRLIEIPYWDLEIVNLDYLYDKIGI